MLEFRICNKIIWKHICYYSNLYEILDLQWDHLFDREIKLYVKEIFFIGQIKNISMEILDFYESNRMFTDERINAALHKLWARVRKSVVVEYVELKWNNLLVAGLNE